MASGSSNHVNASFDPWVQPITFLAPDGRTPLQVSMSTIMTLQHSATYQCISQGIQTGAALMLGLILLIVTSREVPQLRFHHQLAALFLVALRGMLSFIAATGPFYDFYRWATMYYSGLQGAKNVSSAGEAATFLLITTIEVSLAIQVSIVCCNLATVQRLAINIANGVVAFIVCSLRFALMVINIAWGIVGVQHETMDQFKTISKLASATNIALVVSIGISSIFFCAKLGLAIKARRSMGINQFGAMQIIFVMGCQTMCTPLIFTIIAYWGIKDAQLSSVASTIVALSLPLSAMWATANTTNRHAANSKLRERHLVPVGGSQLAKTSKSNYTDASGTLVGDSPRKDDFPEDDIDLESAKLEPGWEMHEVNSGGVTVQRAYSVRAE